MTDTSVIAQGYEQLVQIYAALPEITISGDQHLVFQVRKKIFANYLHNPHRDGRIKPCCKASTGTWRRLRSALLSDLGLHCWTGLDPCQQFL
jgi:hypothetical protein